MPKANTFFDDEDFQDHLVGLLVSDIKALRTTAHLLQPEDFKPQKGMHWGRPRWIIAERALDYYTKHHEPIGKLLRSDILDYVNEIGLGERQALELEEYLKHLRKVRLSGPDSVIGKVLRYKRERIKSSAIEELVELQAAGQLTDDKWIEISHKATETVNGSYAASDFFATLSSRLRRRQLQSSTVRIPWFFIDPLDHMVRGLGPKCLGMVLAPTKRGKSLFLNWMAVAFPIQRFNTILFTLEDPKDEVENRLDAAVTNIPIHRLSERPNLTRRRFRRFLRFVRARLKIIDGTESGLSVDQIEKIVLRERDRGFRADVVIIDYDDEIVPRTKNKERRFEFAEIYRDLRRMAARNNLIVWTAAQTNRNTENLKILTGDKLAEDVSKIRKVAMALSLGKGDWGDESIYIWVAAHKFDHGHRGCHIVTDKERMVIYDREKTRKAEIEFSNMDEEGGSDETSSD